VITTSGSAINARDFEQDRSEADRDTWKPGPMHHLVMALDGARVLIVVDRRTGYTEVGVTLGGVRKTPGWGTYQVLIQREHEGGKTSGCWYPLMNVGTVIELTELGSTGARWTALQAYREQKSQAICKLQAAMVQELGLSDTAALPRGKWDARVFPHEVRASFTPEKILDPVPYTYRSYSLADLAGV